MPVLVRTPQQMEQYRQRPVEGSLWQRAKAVMLNSLNDPSQEVMGLANPMAIAVVPRAAPSAIRAALRLKREGNLPVPEAAQQGLTYMQQALYELADRYPRLASHFRSARIVAPTSPYKSAGEATASFGSGGMESLIRRKGIENAKARALASGEGYFGFEINPSRVPKSIEEAREIAGHEFSHGAQVLMDPSRADLAYELAHQQTGYKQNPAEILARITGTGKRGAYNPSSHEKTLRQLVTGEDPRKAAQAAWRQAREAFVRRGVNSPSSLPPAQPAGRF